MPSRSDQSVQIFRKTVVTVHQPSAEGNPVCLVVELLRINIIEWLQLGFLQDLRMKSCHSIDRITVMNINVRHMHKIIPVNDIHPLILIILPHSCIQITDNRNQVRNRLLQIRNRPFLQRLRQNRMVRIGACLSYHIHRCIRIKALLLQKPDQFRNHHGRMRIINLDTDRFMKAV